MSKELIVEIVAELEALNGLLEARARRLRAAADLFHQIEQMLEEAGQPPFQTVQTEMSRSSETDGG